MGATHTPVLLERCLELLAPALLAAVRNDRDAVHVDATLGLGGHAEAVLRAHERLVLVGLDRDPYALARAGQRLARFADRTHLVQAVYDELPDVLDEFGYTEIDGVLFDLGVSSMQLDEAARGFAYAQDAPLDMRMDPSRGITAEEVVNSYDAAALTRILRVYGEEKFASRIAAAIVRERARRRITSTARLADLVRDAIPAPARRTGGHPAKRSFQALRIEVNGELDALSSALPAALDRLAVGGRALVLSYHSLEDRIVKREMARRAHSSAPADLPIEPLDSRPTLRLLTRGSEVPGAAEVAANPRAASARLRAAERIDPRAGAGYSGPAGKTRSGEAGGGRPAAAGGVRPEERFDPAASGAEERGAAVKRPGARVKALHQPRGSAGTGAPSAGAPAQGESQEEGEGR